MSLFQALTCCFGDGEAETFNTNEKTSLCTASGQPSLFRYDDDLPAAAIKTADKVLHLILTSEKSGQDLERSVRAIVGTNGWVEKWAEAVLNGLENIIRDGAPMGHALKEAFAKAVAESVGFARDHPAYCTLIALGVIVSLGFPWMIEALGFLELGPEAGSFAAFWQSRYLGYVPKNSWFSFFQRLGMVWKRT